ncbi:hypothetical protein [Halorubellus sp. PRR65]|uniref:hypothetical protein n=1 Tax=Halorubellus sp. PRR65 TaxID=3098148 RepID=UPI002B258CB9|nr:hypothetical protein [Halorubellus sp. PRR65]
MVERKWTPLVEEHDYEQMEVKRQEDGVLVGSLDKYGVKLLRDDVIRQFNSGYYDIDIWFTDRGRGVMVRPISKLEFFSVPDGMDVHKAAAIKGISDANVDVPQVVGSSRAAWLKHFETEAEAEEAAEVLKTPIETAYKGMWGDGVDELEVREFEETREWLTPDSWYAIIVHYK